MSHHYSFPRDPYVFFVVHVAYPRAQKCTVTISWEVTMDNPDGDYFNPPSRLQGPSGSDPKGEDETIPESIHKTLTRLNRDYGVPMDCYQVMEA
jgi:hypothetical protein